jgi:adenine deaminase
MRCVPSECVAFLEGVLSTETLKRGFDGDAAWLRTTKGRYDPFPKASTGLAKCNRRDFADCEEPARKHVRANVGVSTPVGWPHPLHRATLSSMPDPHLLAVARGDRPADIVLTGGQVVNVFTGEIEAADVALAGDRVAGVGPGYQAEVVVDLEGSFVVPGLIDAHVHIESSLVTPPQFARAVVPRGTTTVVCDPHEIANVHGLEGVRYMLAASEGLPLSVFVMASSCVPATDMSTSGAELDVHDLLWLKGHPRVLGLAEVMNFPGVILGDREVLAKLDAFQGSPVDGHAPGVRGSGLNAYVAGGPGSDHESTSAEEAIEKLRRGLFVFFREASNARNLGALLPALTPANHRRVALCTDDRHPPDLLDEGGIDSMLRRIIESGVPPVDAIRMATLNAAEYFGLSDRGAVAPGRIADLLIVDELETLSIREVWCGGTVAARGGRPLPWELPEAPVPPSPRMAPSVEPGRFKIDAQPGEARAIEVVPDQIVTRERRVAPAIRGAEVVADPGRDLLKIAVVERHQASGRIAVGLVLGMGLERGAMAGSVAHDHHNVIAVGADDRSLVTVIRAVVAAGGGLAVADGATPASGRRPHVHGPDRRGKGGSGSGGECGTLPGLGAR